MGNDGRSQYPRNGGSNKPPVSGISQDEYRRLIARLDKVEHQLREHFAEKNQWNSLAREWVGSVVVVALAADHNLEGKLLWIDRYTICVEAVPPGGSEARSIIVHKGLVAFMHQR